MELCEQGVAKLADWIWVQGTLHTNGIVDHFDDAVLPDTQTILTDRK